MELALTRSGGFMELQFREPEAVKAVLEGVTVEDVIEEVLESVEVPL